MRSCVQIRLQNSFIYTISAKNGSNDRKRIPVVFISMYIFGICGWVGNIDHIAKDRTVYVFDLLGLSSRPIFNRDPTLIEEEYVRSIEDWRMEMGIDKMILVAHSYGGYLAASYALAYPNRICHLVLVEPWGFEEKKKCKSRQVNIYIFATILRLSGPFALTLLRILRPDLPNYFNGKNADAIYDYIYKCHIKPPTGEIAFSNMSYSHGWAKRPMVERSFDLEVSTTFIYGSRSWMDHTLGHLIKFQRPDVDTDIHVRFRDHS
ncbi:unnamed protein product [Dracunculus medinensis]|uniref:AB hydrolase-1 domain-containing protein n=1 Tax=Dracunculus medinensis TaxID=318479 RepID=A0A0N4UEU5_DRAME|nr:unnamed protein product [Dracunculus medinensis]